MFKRIHIKNFLSCQDVVIDNMSGMTALIGRNGSGKTNIFKAIQWLANCATSTQPIESIIRYPSTQISFVIVLDKNYFRYKLEATFTQETDNNPHTSLNEKLDIQTQTGEWKNIVYRQRDIIRIWGHDTDIQTDIAMPSLPVLTAMMPQKPVVKQIFAIIKFLKAVRYYPLDEPNQPNTEIGSDGYVRHLDYIKWLNKFDRSDLNTSVIMRLLHLFLAESESYDELKTLLGANGLDILENINIIPLPYPVKNKGDDKVNELYFIEFYPSSNRGQTSTTDYFRYKELSFGTRRLLRILVSVISDKSAVLLLEQPEDGIHVELLHKIIPLLKSYSDQGQFILASHSPEVLNRLEPQEIRLVTMKNGITYLRSLDKTDIATAHQFIREQGTLSDFLETIPED